MDYIVILIFGTISSLLLYMIHCICSCMELHNSLFNEHWKMIELVNERCNSTGDRLMRLCDTMVEYSNRFDGFVNLHTTEMDSIRNEIFELREKFKRFNRTKVLNEVGKYGITTIYSDEFSSVST